MEKKNGIFLVSYDINIGQFSSEPINLRILTSLEGISQVNINNSLFICGNNELDEAVSQTSGAFLLFVTNSDDKEVSILINSRYPHFNPSLFGYRDNYLIAVGGKNQKKCEMYNINLNKWKQLQELPEERYQCSLMSDKNDEYLYLFGGKSNESASEIGSILRINLQNYPSQWERIMINEDGNLLSRCKMSTFKSGNSNLIYLLGGEKTSERENEEKYDDVVVYDCFCRIVKQSPIKLKKKAAFINGGFIDINKVQFYFFDSEGDVLMINSKNHNVEVNSFI